jgi:Coenzyme PQQ synthesis protein D (PqqD)
MADRYVVAADVAWIDAADLGMDEPESYVSRLPDGPPLLLQGAAWAIWQGVVDGGSLDDITAHTAVTTDSRASDIAADVAAFVRTLVSDGLVRRQSS